MQVSQKLDCFNILAAIGCLLDTLLSLDVEKDKHGVVAFQEKEAKQVLNNFILPICPAEHIATSIVVSLAIAVIWCIKRLVGFCWKKNSIIDGEKP